MRELDAMHEYLQSFIKLNDKLEVDLRDDKRYTLRNKLKAANNQTPFVAITWQIHSSYISIRIRPNPEPFEKVESLSALKNRENDFKEAIRLVNLGKELS
jgi:hypothetical protein